jgi:hypothetical protein
VVETVPEDLLRLFRGEGGMTIAAACREEIDLVVDVPVFEAVAVFEVLDRRRRTFFDPLEVVHNGKSTGLVA